jgi:hypothetical protein
MHLCRPPNLSLAIAASLSACGSTNPPSSNATADVAASATNVARPVAELTSADCLPPIWRRQSSPDRAFDQANDRLDGTLLSCKGFTSASALRQGITALQAAAATRQRDRISALVAYPFHYIDAANRHIPIRSQRQFLQRFDSIFTADTYRAISALELKDVQIDFNQGLSFSSGGIWFWVPDTGGVPKLRTVNLSVLNQVPAHQSELR